MHRQVRKLAQQLGAIMLLFAHADDAAAADLDAGATHVIERIETILVRACADDLAVELRRGIEIVVVVIEPGVGHTVGSRRRSEEHTSELQPLMRTAYAVFCLTTKPYRTLYLTTYTP